jgi:hypothetical protein
MPRALAPRSHRFGFVAVLRLGALVAGLWGSTGYGQAQPQVLPETPVRGTREDMPQPEQFQPERPEPPVPQFSPLLNSGRTQPVANTFASPVSASQGLVTQADIQNKPLFRTTEFLEQIPGLIFSNETNGVDAATMFLRGFNIDHGTDFAFFVDGVPYNLGSNPHAQGFTDLNSVIPELVSTVDFGKGPYYAKVGNFSAVGYADIRYFDALPYGIAKIEAGQYDWFRTVVADSGCVGPGVLLYGVQFNYFNNAFSVPEHLNKSSAIFRYTIAEDNDRLTLSASLYNGQGTSEPVIPLRLVQNGQIGRFTNVSPSDFIVANRFVVNAQWQHHWVDGALTQGNVYGYRYTLGLIENPSGFTSGPEGDQVDQIDQRWVTGVNLSHTWHSYLLGDQMAHTVGIQYRHDDIRQADIFNSVNREPVSPASLASIGESDTGLFYQNALQWSEKVRTVFGVRGEFYHVHVNNQLTPENSGDKSSAIFLPKGSLILGPWNHTDFYVNGGYSFHSNNAEGTVVNIDPATGDAVPRVPLLIQARGAEVGVRSQFIPNLTTSLALWQLHLGSELEFDVVAETTTPLRPSDRYGLEWSNTYQLCRWLSLNADYSWSHGRLLGFDPDVPGNRIPQAVTTVFSGGPSVNLPNGLFANLRYRYWGPRPLIEDNSFSSRATNLFELSAGYQCPRYTVNLQILNLFNSNGHDIDFFDTTFYPNFGDTAPVADKLFKPLQPFQARVSVTVRW